MTTGISGSRQQMNNKIKKQNGNKSLRKPSYTTILSEIETKKGSSVVNRDKIGKIM